MKETGSNISRRKFIALGSAAIASPLLSNMAGSAAETKITEAESAVPKADKPTKVYFINRTCIGCQVCRTFCPVKAIHFGDGGNEIDQKKCIHCGTCYRECPISVISETIL
jgi:ferredoxin